jgi:hypothetical protein
MSSSRPTLVYLRFFALVTFLTSLVVLAPSPSSFLFPARETKSLHEQLNNPLRLWLPNNLNWSLLPQQVSLHFV